MRRMQHKSREAAIEDWNTHTCPWGSGTKVSWSVTKTLVEQMWHMLDREVDSIKGHVNADGQVQFAADPTYHQTRARAFAESIAIFMTPFFATADDVVRESLKRWQARKDGDTEYETAGLGHRRYESAALAHASAAEGWYSTPNDGYTSDPSKAGSQPRRRTTVRTPAPAIKPGDLESMKHAHEQMPTVFTVEVLAAQYKYPVEAVRAALVS